MRRFFRSFLWPCSTVCLCFGQSSPPLLTLSDAVALAHKQNAQIQISSLDVSKAVEETNQLKTQRLPVFKVYANVGESLLPINLTIPKGALGVYPATGPIPAQDSPIKTARQITGVIFGTATQPISQLFKISLGLKEARVTEELAREKERQQMQDTTQQVKQAYYQLTQIQSEIASAEVNLQYLNELSAYVDRNLAQETVLKSDSLNVKAKLSQQRFQLVTLHDRLDTQKESLNRLLGRDLRAAFTTEAEPPPSNDEVSLEAAQTKALEQRPEIRQALLKMQKAALEVRREHAEYLPDLSAQLSYVSFPNLNFLPKNVLLAGITFEWQPLDWGQKRHKMSELQSSSKQAVLTEHDAQQQILLDVNASYRKLSEARALLAVDAATQELEREKLRVLTNQYREKAALLTDVLQEQSALAQADAQYRQDLESVWTAKAAFDRALGEQ